MPTPSQFAAATLGPQPLPAPAAFSAAVSAIPPPPPLVSAVAEPPPAPPVVEPAPPEESFAALPDLALTPMAERARVDALAAEETDERRAVDPTDIVDIRGTAAASSSMSVEDMARPTHESEPPPPLELDKPPARVPVVESRVGERDTRRPVPRADPNDLTSRRLVSRGIAPPLAAAAVALGILIGFAGGRATAPRAHVAVTPEIVAAPLSTVPGATVTATATKVAVASPRATAKPASSAAGRAPPVDIAVASAIALDAAGEGDDAVIVLDGIVEETPSNADAHWALAGMHRAKRRGPKACIAYRAYSKHAPSGEHAAEARKHIAVCNAVALLDEEKIDEAYAAFGAIVKSGKNFPDGHYWLATMQALRNENPAACASFLSYLNLDSTGPYSDRAVAQLGALGC